MFDLATLEYRLIAITKDAAQIDLTPITNSLGWSEGDKELAAKITFKCAVNLGEQNITDVINVNTQLIVYAKFGDEDFQEVCRGRVEKFGLVESNREFLLDVEAADEAAALRHSQEDYFFSPDSSSTSILEKILKDHGVNAEIHVEDTKHEKKIFRGKYLSDMLTDVLKDLKEKTGKVYFIRARAGVIEIIERGTNETIYDFDIENNLVKVSDSFDASKLVTKVKVVGKQREEGHQHVDAVVEGRTDLGERQVIYARDDKTNLEEAQKAAKKILDENGIKRKISIEAPDLPTLRKGDRIRLRSSLGEGFFLIKSIRHDAAQMKMNAELDYDKKYSEEQRLEVYDLAQGSETESDAP